MDAKSKKGNKEVAVTKTVESGSTTNRPVKTFRIDDISCSIWARTFTRVEPVTMYSVSYQRSFRNVQGEWKHSQYFNLGDLPKIVSLSQQAEEFVHDLQQKDAA